MKITFFSIILLSAALAFFQAHVTCSGSKGGQYQPRPRNNMGYDGPVNHTPPALDVAGYGNNGYTQAPPLLAHGGDINNYINYILSNLPTTMIGYYGEFVYDPRTGFGGPGNNVVYNVPVSFIPKSGGYEVTFGHLGTVFFYLPNGFIDPNTVYNGPVTHTPDLGVAGYGNNSQPQPNRRSGNYIQPPPRPYARNRHYQVPPRLRKRNKSKSQPNRVSGKNSNPQEPSSEIENPMDGHVP